MTAIPLARAEYRRKVAKEADILLRNRFFEEVPALSTDNVSLLARPGERRQLDVGDGPIRLTYTCPGTFSEDLFVVSALVLYRVSAVDFTVTEIGTIGTQITDSVSVTAVANIGDTPEHLFICDGGILWCYTEDGYAKNNLEATGAIIANETVTIDGVYYKWTSGSVDASAPDGTAAHPWLVLLGGSTADSLTNLYQAINQEGTAGTTYSTALVANPSAVGYNVSATELFVRAIVNGASGDGIAVAETGAHIAWASSTFTGGGTPSLLQVPTPNDVGAISLSTLASYVFVIPVQGAGVNGQFYWINPGETTIDPLDFATAERAPDAIYETIVFSDQVWFCGQTTVETWYMSGDPDAPVLRTQGILFDRGTWQGTAIQVNDSMILVDPDGGVYQVAGGVKPISTPDIAERIRKAIKLQAAAG